MIKHIVEQNHEQICTLKMLFIAICYSSLRHVASCRYSWKLQNIKLATRTKTNIELQKKAIQMSDQKRQLTYILGISRPNIKMSTSRGWKRISKSQTFRLHTNSAQTAKSTWSLKQVIRTRGVQRRAEQRTVPNKKNQDTECQWI